MLLSLCSCDVFLMTKLGFGFWGENTTEVNCLSHHIKDLYYQHNLSLMMLTLITWLRNCLPGFYTVKFLFSPFHLLFFGGKALSLAHTYQEAIKLQTLVYYFFN